MLWSVAGYWTGELGVSCDIFHLLGDDDLDVGHFVVAEAEQALQEAPAVVCREVEPEPAGVLGECRPELEV